MFYSSPLDRRCGARGTVGDRDIEILFFSVGCVAAFQKCQHLAVSSIRETTKAADFELVGYRDKGEPLGAGQGWQVCVTLNLVRTTLSIGICPPYKGYQ